MPELSQSEDYLRKKKIFVWMKIKDQIEGRTSMCQGHLIFNH
jgi:hypothetical protein